MGILPTNLPKETKLLLIYENRTMDVHLLTPVLDLENQQRITVNESTISFFSYFESFLLDFTFELSLFHTQTTFISLNSL
jgi:hypothetical protein